MLGTWIAQEERWSTLLSYVRGGSARCARGICCVGSRKFVCREDRAFNSQKKIAVTVNHKTQHPDLVYRISSPEERWCTELSTALRHANSANDAMAAGPALLHRVKFEMIPCSRQDLRAPAEVPTSMFHQLFWIFRSCQYTSKFHGAYSTQQHVLFSKSGQATKQQKHLELDHLFRLKIRSTFKKGESPLTCVSSIQLITVHSCISKRFSVHFQCEFNRTMRLILSMAARLRDESCAQKLQRLLPKPQREWMPSACD